MRTKLETPGMLLAELASGWSSYLKVFSPSDASVHDCVFLWVAADTTCLAGLALSQSERSRP